MGGGTMFKAMDKFCPACRGPLHSTNLDGRLFCRKCWAYATSFKKNDENTKTKNDVSLDYCKKSYDELNKEQKFLIDRIYKEEKKEV